MTVMKKTNGVFHVGSIIAAAAILIATGVTGYALLITPQQVIASIEDPIEEEEEEEEERVAVGGGNITFSVNQFSP
jgi:hypothetical protein